MKFVGYGERCWGLTACLGPEGSRVVDGKSIQFRGYTGPGAPAMFQNLQKSGSPDDGTISPWAAFASLPFAPEIVMPTIQFFEEMDLGVHDLHGYRPSFNQTFKDPGVIHWVLGLPLEVRDRPGADRLDGRELSDRVPLGDHEEVQADCGRPEEGRLHRRLAGQGLTVDPAAVRLRARPRSVSIAGADLMATLHEKTTLRVDFVSLTEALDLATPAGRALAGMLAIFVEFEREILRELVRAGIPPGKDGRPHGRPRTASRKPDEVLRLKAERLSRLEISRRLGIGRPLVRRTLAAGSG